MDSVLEWFVESARTPQGKSVLLQLWDELAVEEGNNQIDFDHLLGRIHHEINLSESKKILKKSNHNIVNFRRREYFMKILLRAAAVLLLPALGFGFYMSYKYETSRYDYIAVNQVYNEVFSSVDAITKVTLPDGSGVWLNHNSSLKYPAFFSGNSRKVELNGEGYFEVIPNSKVPFIVTAGKLQVVARGTVFNIMAYPEEDNIEISLIKGMVELQKPSAKGIASSLRVMKPTDISVYQKISEEVSTRSINDNRYYSWRFGKLIFNAEPMDQVIRKLSRWFNVDIQIRDVELNELNYTATFVNETLPQVMELMTLMTPVSYTISNREVTENGTFAKRKVILTKKNK